MIQDTKLKPRVRQASLDSFSLTEFVQDDPALPKPRGRTDRKMKVNALEAERLRLTREFGLIDVLGIPEAPLGKTEDIR